MKPTGSAISDVERVRDAADIVRVVGDHLTLKAKGREFVGLCPFHDDHKPSMCVVPHKQIFHCFVCGAGGDVFSFIERYHRMEFREALEYLAERCNITLTKRSAQRTDAQTGDAISEYGVSESRATRGQLAEANAQAASFFRAVLNHEDHGKIAREIIERRGISPEMVERFTLGAAPDRWDGLAMKVDAMGQDRELFAAAGLLKARETGGHFDFFRNRLMFPIRDQIGRVIAFGGRIIDEEDTPKYLNSPDSPLFHKSAAIFGLHQAVQAIQRERTVIITEGYTDVIACHQAGIEHAVATLGTALTPGHATILRRLCDTVVLLFDGDAAGLMAADRAVEVFFHETIDVRIATLDKFTDAKDPDELLKREGGREVFDRAIAGSIDILDFRFSRLHAQVAGAGVSEMQRVTVEELRRLAQLGFHKSIPVRQQLIVKRLMKITGLDNKVLLDQMRRAKPRPNQYIEHEDSRPEDEAMEMADAATDPRRLIEALGCILTDGSLWLTLSEEERSLLAPESFATPAARAIAEAVRKVAQAGKQPVLRAVLDTLEEAAVKAKAVSIQTHTEQTTEERLAAYLADCLMQERRRRAETAPATPPTEDAPPEQDADFAAMIARQRKQIEEFGPDRRRIARASGRG
ncbi:DNA primase [hydrothermal vent metagenome]|uniref:DNA primase n=1 Tax=hydrothermal vent metagenome TaxID=652676 RepID=A0A3B1DSP4_9ZZZZ